MKSIQGYPLHSLLPVFKRFLLGVSLLAVLGGGLLYIFAGRIYQDRDTVDLNRPLPPIDAIVCLGGGRGRIMASGDLWLRYWEQTQKAQAPVLYLSGMGPQTSWYQLSKQLRSGTLRSLLRPLTVIEKESSNTEANAVWLVRYAQEHHWKRILLLTSSYHMKRARFIFSRILNSAQTPIEMETLSISQEPFTRERWRADLNGIRVTFEEFIKGLYYQWFWRP